MEISKSETAASSTETRSEVGQLTQSLGHVTTFISTEEHISQMPGSNKVRRLPTPRWRSIDRRRVDELLDRLIGKKIIERSIAMKVKRGQGETVNHMTASPEMQKLICGGRKNS